MESPSRRPPAGQFVAPDSVRLERYRGCLAAHEKWLDSGVLSTACTPRRDDSLAPRFGGVYFFRRKPGSEAAGMNGKYEYSKERKIGFIVGTIHEDLATIGGAGP
jgi:hypothetical protein